LDVSGLQELYDQGFDVLVRVIEAVAGFAEIEMEELFGHAAVRV
jgi:hypothetical protein